MSTFVNFFIFYVEQLKWYFIKYCSFFIHVGNIVVFVEHCIWRVVNFCQLCIFFVEQQKRQVVDFLSTFSKSYKFELNLQCILFAILLLPFYCHCSGFVCPLLPFAHLCSRDITSRLFSVWQRWQTGRDEVKKAFI